MKNESRTDISFNLFRRAGSWVIVTVVWFLVLVVIIKSLALPGKTRDQIVSQESQSDKGQSWNHDLPENLES